MPHFVGFHANERAADIQLGLDDSCCISYNMGMEPYERLEKWREVALISKAEMARRVGCDKGNFHRVLGGYLKPSLEMAAEIERVTGGAIDISSWVGFVPREREPKAA